MGFPEDFICSKKTKKKFCCQSKAVKFAAVIIHKNNYNE